MLTSAPPKPDGMQACTKCTGAMLRLDATDEEHTPNSRVQFQRCTGTGIKRMHGRKKSSSVSIKEIILGHFGFIATRGKQGPLKQKREEVLPTIRITEGD